MLDMWKAEAMGSQRVQDSERLKKIRGEWRNWNVVGGGHVSLPRDGVPQQEVDPFSTVSARWDGGSDHILLDSPKDDMIT